MSLRDATIQLAHTNEALRPLLLPLLKEAGSYQDYVEKKKREHETPLDKDEWEARTQGKGKSESEGENAPSKDKPAEKEPSSVSSKVKGFLDSIKGISKAMASSVMKAPAKVQEFVHDPAVRKEAVSDMAAKMKASPKKVVDAVKTSARKELHELKHATSAVAKVLRKPPETWTKEDKQAVYSAAVYVAGAALAAMGGGPLVAAGAVGKSFAMHVGIKALHDTLDRGFVHFEAVETALHALHLAAEEDAEDALLSSLTASVGHVLAKGISDKDMESILKGTEEPDMSEFADPKPPKGKSKGAALRSDLIRLAHQNEALRPLLLPILASEKAANDMHVQVRELPVFVQRELKNLGYGRRDIRVEAKSTISLLDSGGDGFQGFALVMNLVTGESKLYQGSWGGPNPWAKANPVDSDDRQHPIPMNGAVIKGWRGGGRPVYAVLYVNPDNMAALLPAPVDLTPQEDMALAIIQGLKPGYRGEYFERHDLGVYNAQNPVLKSLVQKGLVKATGAGIQITTEGKNAVNRSLRP